MEPDVYWATFAGASAVALLNSNPGRCSLLHLKDMDKTASKLYTCPGESSLDFAQIFQAAKKAGVKYYNAEMDEHPHPMDCVANSYKYLKGLSY
jgi:sugar phosphate isomerase/epimerase